MITTLVQNVALIIALVVVYQLIVHKWRDRRRQFIVISGMLFGGVGVISMMTPFVFAEGVVIDGRSIILAVAGFFGGPVIAAIAVVICAAYRFWMGGGGALVGVAVVAVSAGVGVGGYYLRTHQTWMTRALPLLGFGLLVHLMMIALLLLVPEVGTDLVRNTGWIVILLFPLATMLICLIFWNGRNILPPS